MSRITEADIKDAKKRMARSIIGSPFVYPQFGALQGAKRAVEDAKQKLAEAQKVWDALLPVENRACQIADPDAHPDCTCKCGVGQCAKGLTQRGLVL